MEKRVLRAGGRSKSEMSKPKCQEGESNSRFQERVIKQVVRAVVIKSGSSLESLGEFESTQTKKQCLSPIPRSSE